MLVLSTVWAVPRMIDSLIDCTQYRATTRRVRAAFSCVHMVVPERNGTDTYLAASPFRSFLPQAVPTFGFRKSLNRDRTRQGTTRHDRARHDRTRQDGIQYDMMPFFRYEYDSPRRLANVTTTIVYRGHHHQ